MADPADLDCDENWAGGFYELALELGARDDDRLDGALRSVWRELRVEGCVEEVQHAPRRHAPAELTLTRPGAGHLHGVVTLPSGRGVVCGAVAIRLDEADWLDFYLPLGALVETDGRIGGFPFGEDGGSSSLAWRTPIDEWLRAAAERVHAVVPLRLALVGFEAAAQDDLASLVAGGVPSDRQWGYLVPGPAGPAFHPANR